MNRTHLLKHLVAAAASLLASVAALAQTGTVSGRIADQATGLALGGVRVTVEGSPLETYSEANGRFALVGVPAGARTFVFSYVGYSDEVLTSEVAEGRTNQLDVLFGEDVTQLDAVIIEGSLVGTARAINEQRASATLRNIVAADEIGNFPDQNAAESLQRLPGLALYRDQGEGRYIVLRGLNYTFTSVKLNGSSFAGADLGERATALDVVPTDAIGAIEVTKVPTPDMDAEGLAGQVNIRSKSPFDYDGLAANLTAQGTYSDLRNEWGYKFNGLVSTRFGEDGKYGLILMPSFQNRKFSSFNFETGGSSSLETNPVDGQDYYVFEELDFRDYEVERERSGLSAGFEAKPDSDTLLFLRASYNEFNDSELRHLTRFAFGDGTLADAGDDFATFTGSSRMIARRLRIREKDQQVFTAVAGGERQIGALKVDATAGFTEGREERPDEITARFRPNTSATRITYTTPGTYEAPVISQVGGANLLNASSYGFHRIDYSDASGRETSWDFSTNARYDLATAAPSFLKAGVAYRTKEKTAEEEAYEIGGNPAGFNLGADNIGPGEYPYLAVPRISSDVITRGFYANYLPLDPDNRLFLDSEVGDWSADEDVLAAYLMGQTKFDRLTVIAGARVERTEFSSTGNLVVFNDDPATDSSTLQTLGRDYTNFLPGVHLRYDLTPRLVLRASWSNSIARPDFGSTAFTRLIDNDAGEIVVGNPALEELTSTNWDASVEYYLPSLGVLSAAVFHKSIENFSYEFDAGTDPVTGYDVTTFGNGSEGNITGLELGYQQQLTFLPEALSGFGVLANFTLLDADATYPTRPGEKLPFIGQSKYLGNLGLTYENKRLFVRLALNFRGERLREDETIGGADDEDLYVDDFMQLDLTARYEITKNFEVFAEALNLTNEPFRVFQKNTGTDGGKRLAQFEEYGWSTNFGLRWKL